MMAEGKDIDTHDVDVEQSTVSEASEFETPEEAVSDIAVNNDTDEEPTVEVVITKAPPNPKRKKNWKTFLMWLAFGAIIVGTLIFTLVQDISETGSIVIDPIFKDNWWFLLLALGAAIMYLIFRAMSSSVLMHSLTGKFRFGISLSGITRSRFYDLVTPLAVGGQPFQMLYLQKKNLPKGVATTIPVAEYAIHYVAFTVLSIAAILLTASGLFGNNVPVNTTIYIMATVGLLFNLSLPVLLVIFLISPPLCKRVTRRIVTVAKFLRLTKHPDKLYRSIMTGLKNNMRCMKTVFRKKQALLCFVFAIAASLMSASIGYFVIKAFGFGTVHGWGWVEIVALNIVIANSVSFIPTPGNAGAADLSFWWMFRSVIPGSAAIAVLIWRFLGFYFYIIVGFFHVIRPRRKRKSKQVIENTQQLNIGGN